MERSVVYLVGDKFKRFSEANPGVVTQSDLENVVETRQLGSDLLVVIGQGLNQERLATLRRRMRENRLEERILFAGGVREPIERDHVHKQSPENVMIGQPTKVSETEFDIPVLVDERCAEMSDHVTGQHVQGMVLLEAARQAFLAVTECFYMEAEQRGRYYFVIQDLRMRYESFAFPLPTAIRYRIDRADIDKRGNMAFGVHMAFRQGGQVVSEAAVSFVAYVWRFVERMESQRARQALLGARQELAGLVIPRGTTDRPGQIGPETAATALPTTS